MCVSTYIIIYANCPLEPRTSTAMPAALPTALAPPNLHRGRPRMSRISCAGCLRARDIYTSIDQSLHPPYPRSKMADKSPENCTIETLSDVKKPSPGRQGRYSSSGVETREKRKKAKSSGSTWVTAAQCLLNTGHAQKMLLTSATIPPMHAARTTTPQMMHAQPVCD